MTKAIKNQENNAVRADVLLARAYPEYSRAALAKLFDLGAITQNRLQIKAGAKIKSGQKINADLTELNKKVANIELPIIYEDENVIVIDKPVGVISHARGRYWDEPSVASFVRQKVSGLTGERAGIVHRLDRATSGVMICAKNVSTLSFLQKQFSQRKTKKSYYAIIKGTLSPQQAIIDVPICRNSKDPKTFKPDSSGKQAITQYKVAQSSDDFSLLELWPKTGRTHQLRVHLKYLNRPILGDVLYGGDNADRLFLHAYSLEITLPGGIRKTFTSQLPSCFKDKIQ